MKPTPTTAPFPVETFLQPTALEQSQIGMPASQCASDLPCAIPVQVGLFFDGTNNNMERDLNGVRTGLLDPQTKKPVPMPKKPLKPEELSHSNVVRLFLAYPGDKRPSGFFRYYMPGVGTPFPEIGEPTESADGKAFAKGGQPRIVWGLLQVLNSIHAANSDKNLPLYSDKEAGQLAQDYDREVGRSKPGANDRNGSVVTAKDWFAEHLDKLEAILKARPKPHIPSLTISVFGFSRGAAEAVAFCHALDELLEGGALCGVPTTISFLGVFDTVASVGGSASVSKTMPLPGFWFDGHWAWANCILKPLPGCVSKGAHYIAAHEMRMNFPVTTLQGSMEEVYFPGVHSDVGGGYTPGDQGKARGAQAAMLSQIPLAHMFKAARAAGVPLTPYSMLAAQRQDDFSIDPQLASAWDAYTAALGHGGGVLKNHMALYYRWRAARLATLTGSSNYQAASAQDQCDMLEANNMLAGDLEALRVRKKTQELDSDLNPIRPYTYRDSARINQWHYRRAQNGVPLDKWEQEALTIFDKPEPLPVDVMRFFDDYVHDSFAGFYLAGEVTEFDKRTKVAEVLKENPARVRGFDKKVLEVTQKTQQAQAKQKAGEALNPEEAALVKEAEFGTPYPLMTDADTADMRSAAIKTQTDTRREGGGYILRRGYYPQSGFIRREYIREDELNRDRVTVVQPQEHAGEKDKMVAYEWSDNLQRDIALAQKAQQERVTALA